MEYINQQLIYIFQLHKEVPHSDTNLRSHLARHHNLLEYLYPSQRLRYQSKISSLSRDLKKNLMMHLYTLSLRTLVLLVTLEKLDFNIFFKLLFREQTIKVCIRTQ